MSTFLDICSILRVEKIVPLIEERMIERIKAQTLVGLVLCH